MIKRRLMMIAVFAALMTVPILGQPYATDQAAGAQVAPSVAPSGNITSVLNVTPASSMVVGVGVAITNVSFLGDEWVTIANQGEAPINLNGWVLTNDAGRFRYIFPSQTLTSGSILRVHFGHGFDVGPDVYLGLAGDMLSDTGDVVTIYDSSGAIVSRYAYPGVVQAQQALPAIGAAFPSPVVQPVGQVQRGVLVEPGEFSPASRGAQILPNATTTSVTQLANVSAIFETNRAVNVNVTNVGITGDEFIQVTNEGSVPVNLTGWALTAGASFNYTFPAIVLPVGNSLRVHPGAGMSTPTDLYLNQAQAVLDDSAGVVTLFNSEGMMISRFTYPGGTSGLVETPGMVRAPGTQPILFGNVTPGVLAGPSPSGEEFLQAPVQALPNATAGQVQQVITGSG